MSRGWLIGAVTGLFLVVMLAAALQGAPRISPITSTPEPLPAEPLPEISATPSPTPTLPPEPSIVAGVLGAIMLAVLILLGLVGVVLLILWAVRALIRAWRNRPLQRRDGDSVGFAMAEAPSVADPHVITTVIQRGIAGALQQIDSRPVPTDAIIAAWMGLEESAADAGLTRGRSETPGEFTVRIITWRTGISADAKILLRLYERVRFGGHVADEEDRATARAALRSIEAGWR